MENKSVITALAALAQDSRLAIVRLLVQPGSEGLSVGKIGETLGIAPSSLSFLTKELAHANLVSSRQESRFVIYCANFQTTRELVAFLNENCCNGLSCTAKSNPQTHPTPRKPMYERQNLQRSFFVYRQLCTQHYG